jgi:hypothetical protein
MTSPSRLASLRYLVATLAQISETMREFELPEESDALDAVTRRLEEKFPLLQQQEEHRPLLRRRQ